MALNVATLAVRIQANSTQAQQGISGLVSMLAGGGGIALGAAAAAVAVAGIGVASVKMAGDFQSGLTTLVTGAGESQKNLKLVQQGILSLATKTGTSTKDLISGMYQIESAGYHGKAGLDVLKAAAEGAKVGNADLGTVSNATTTIMTDFAASHVTAAQAVNTLIGTVSRGKTTLQDLSGALSQVLPTASAAKIGLNDTMGAMATMTGEGVPAAEAATYLRQTILALQAPSKASEKALAGIGLSSSQVATEMQKSLPDALKMIQTHLANTYTVGSPQYVAALKNIAGGSRQMQGLLDLTGTHLKTFQDNVHGVSDAVKKGGTHIAGWTTVQGTFNQKMDVLNQVVQTSMIRLGTHLLPIVTKLAGFLADHLPGAIDKVTGAFGKVAAIGGHVVKFFQDTGPVATTVKIALLGLAGAMAGMAASAIPDLVTSLIASVTAFGAQTVAAAAAAIATMAAMLPFILIGAAIGIVIGIIILAVTHWKQITTALSHFGQMAQKIGGAIKDFASQALQHIVDFLKTALGWFIDFEVKVPLAILGMAASALGHVKDFIGNVLGHIKDFVGNLLAKFAELEIKGVQFFLSLGGKALDAVKTMVGNLIGKALDLDRQFTQWGLNLVTHVMGALASLPGKMLDLGKNLIQSLISGITSMAGGVGKAIANIPVIGGMASKLGSLIPHFAEGGTMPGGGGFALVGEHGPEIVNMPGGAKITPIANSSGVSGTSALAMLPGGTPMYGASGSMNGQMVHVILTVDGKKLAAAVLKAQPDVVRNATGARTF